ncbi:hypothetical protein ACSBR1_038480 [Camellia fascicularis]
MERYKCKLCSKAFANGRALGGHMRSHLANLPIPPKTQKPQQLSEPTESASSLSSSSEEEQVREESEEKALVYGLRENPKRSFRLVDPEFLDGGSVVQDRESETESSRNPTRRRSKRTRKSPKLKKPSSTESVTELEQVSSVSDASTEEDVALCLMMLSRDTWSSDDSGELRPPSQRKYQCETCKKEFGSFQALGGHRTSHTKVVKSCIADNVDQNQKVHECPICFKVFGSGQALGGHKRSHLLSSSKSASKFGESLIDLNLPAPMEDEDEDDDDDDDEHSQLEISAVSDAEFIKH